jgi:thiamine-monophosphate kinase
VPGADGERAAIERIRIALPQAPDDETWIGDDAAVVPGPGAGSLLLAADTVVEGVHFDLDLVEASDVGWKVLAVNVSDIAAMGGTPLHALVTIVGASNSVIDGLVSGLAEACSTYDCAVVGGDLSSGPLLVVTVAITGTTGGGRAVLRTGAHAGDQIFVTGPLGRSSAGLRALRAHPGDVGPADLDLVAAYRRPQARVAEGLAASGSGATAMIDISDGLGIDLDRLATASGIGIVLDDAPAACGATYEDALAGGEDYELIFTAADSSAVSRVFAEAGLRPPIRIGECVADRTARLIGGQPLAASGWEHRLR